MYRVLNEIELKKKEKSKMIRSYDVLEFNSSDAENHLYATNQSLSMSDKRSNMELVIDLQLNINDDNAAKCQFKLVNAVTPDSTTMLTEQDDLKTPTQIDSIENPSSDSESIEIVPPTMEALMLMKSTNIDSDAIPMHHSCQSTTSTNNTDICILGAHESHYCLGDIEQAEHDDDDNYHQHYFQEDHYYCHQLDHSANSNDFTVLHAPTQQRQHHFSCDIEESTEVITPPPANLENHRKTSQTYSGTDSDVEVLMSEEVIDSDWSAGAAALEDSEITAEGEEKDDIEKSVQTVSIESKSTSALGKGQESPDQEMSVEEFNHISMSECEKMNREQLLNVIRGQAERLLYMEATLQRYRSAQQKLYECVDDMRAEFKISSFKRSHETIH